MQNYQGKELDHKIKVFLHRKTQKFPELHRQFRLEKD